PDEARRLRHLRANATLSIESLNISSTFVMLLPAPATRRQAPHVRPRSTVQMAAVEIYTARYCPYSAAAKALLKRKGVAFKEFDIGGNWELRDEMIKRANGQVTVPQIFIGQTHVGGNDDLQALERAGKLDALLRDTRG